MTEKIDYEIEYREEFGGWSIVVKEPCPECGNDVVFNGSITATCQYVGYDETEDGDQICGPDDTLNVTVDELRCGKCDLLVVNT